MDDTWDEYAEGWDSNPDAIKYSEKAFDCLVEVTNIEGAEVFNLGCGTGLLTERIAPRVKSVVAIDTSPKMIEVLTAKNLSNVHPICGSLSEILLKNHPQYQSRFDLVVASSVCAFVPDFSEVLREIKTILKPGGQFVQWDWLSPDESSHPGFTNRQLSDAIEKAGFLKAMVSKGFTMSGAKGDAAVLMATAQK